MKTRLIRWSCVAALLLAAGQSARAMFAMPNAVPVDRLIKNTEAFIAKHPEDAEARYTLGRIHYLAVALRTGTVGVYYTEEGKLPSVAREGFQGRRNDKTPTTVPATDELARHMQAAIDNLRQAIDMDGKNPVFHLTLASALEATPADVARQMGGLPLGEKAAAAADPDKAEALIAKLGDTSATVRDEAQAALLALSDAAVPALVKKRDDLSPEAESRVKLALKRLWEERALPEYAKAFDLSQEKDGALKWRPLAGLSELVSFEAANHYVALSGQRPRTPAETALAEKMNAHLTKLNALQRNAITPIIFSLEDARPLDALLAPGRTVSFNLDGTARCFQWPWVAPETSILVWDPDREGAITSGRQLFGSVTFGLLLHDGYRALELLDDNGDGQLTGAELTGLSVWRDRNGNGISDPGEVLPIEATGVTALAVHATSQSGDSPTNDAGLTLTNGHQLPTYDWVTQPAKSTAETHRHQLPRRNTPRGTSVR